MVTFNSVSIEWWLIQMDIFIEKLHIRDAEDLLKFELENRTFFEEMVPTRGVDYYTPNIFNKKLEALLDEQFQGVSYYFLIKDRDNSIIGRINLVDIDESRKVGHLGYRIGQVHTGKGIASKALTLLLESISDKEIKLIEAKTTTNNVASQKVLEKNGFERLDRSDKQFEMNGQKVSFVYYRWTNRFDI